MTWIMVDVETDGPIPGDYSLIEIGAVVMDKQLDKTFFAQLKPISEKFNPEALAVFETTREQTLAYEDPKTAMLKFKNWIATVSKDSKRVNFISDNNGFDYMFICWYFHHFLGENPFGHSSTNLGSLYKGLVKDVFKNFKHLRKTFHDHNPVNDSKGNAEALLHMKNELGLIIKF